MEKSVPMLICGKNVRFPEDVLYEDLYVNSEILLNAKKLIATDQVLYDNNHYNEKSVSALGKRTPHTS